MSGPDTAVPADVLRAREMSGQPPRQRLGR